MIRLVVALAVACVGAGLCGPGCGSKDRDTGKQGAAHPPATGSVEPAAPAVILDSRTQYDLAEAIKRASRLPEDDAAQELGEIRRSYQGKRFRWRVYHIPIMCPDAARCHVLPFDRTGADKEIVQGWMPRLALDESAWTSMRERCADEKRCTLVFEGTLERLVLSTEMMTSLAFTDVSIVSVASQSSDEP